MKPVHVLNLTRVVYSMFKLRVLTGHGYYRHSLQTILARPFTAKQMVRR